MTQTQDRRLVFSHFVVYWTVAVVAARLVGFRVPGDALGLLPAVVLAGAQWIVLQRWFTWAWQWALATLIGLLAGTWLLRESWGLVYPQGWAPQWGLVGLIWVVQAIPQWLVLRRRGNHAAWWLISRPIVFLANRLIGTVMLGDATIWLSMGVLLYVPAILVQAVADGVLLAWILGPQLTRTTAATTPPPPPGTVERGLRLRPGDRLVFGCAVVTMVALTVSFLVADEADIHSFWPLLIAFLIPYGLVVALLLHQRTRHFGFTLAVGAGAAVSIVIGPLIALAVLLEGMMGTGSRQGDLFPWIAALALQLTLVVSAARGAKRLPAHERRPRAWLVGTAFPVVYVAIVAAGFTGLQSSRTLRHAQLAANDSGAWRGVQHINECAARYAEAHPEQGFPADLGALGPDGDQCLTGAVASGESAGYRFRYTAGVPDVSGRVQVYAICARPMRTGDTGRSIYVSDEHGAVSFVGAPDADEIGACAAAWHDDPVSAIKSCLVTYASEHQTEGYPASLELLGERGNGCLTSLDSVRVLSRTTLLAGNLLYTYLAGPVDARGRLSAFEILGGPLPGSGGPRYFCNESGRVSVTREDRLATSRDPTRAERRKAEEERTASLARGVPKLTTACDQGELADCLWLAEALLGRMARNRADATRPSSLNDADAGARQASLASDAAQAGTALEKACAGGRLAACVRLADLLAQDGPLPHDPGRAVTLYETACAQDAADGCDGLARAYQNDGAPSGPRSGTTSRLAADLYEKACRLGRGEACLSAATLYDRGEYVSRDTGRAAELYDAACAGGFASACRRLGQMYEQGESVPIDTIRAARLYRRACAGEQFPECDTYR